ncbi:MAG: ferrous iron transport protein B [Muribaculaceae bacterium]|nr:ferrous iron transport protein B [Muribaculaceae bacterium]MBR1963967.1 ferrous iron transport protein B [Muribaculaceae bacterium]
MRLSELKTGETGIIVKIQGHGAFRKRVIEMGFVKGRPITASLSAPLRDPIKYSLMGYEVSLRRSEANLVEIIPVKDADKLPDFTHVNVVDDSADETSIEFRGQSRTINIALIGNPNCGKTSLFNIASGSHEHVGNYSGVTVDATRGKFSYGGYNFNIVDLPGTYSLSAYSPEELYVRRYLKDETPDVIVNVVVASNLERNLYLSTELIDMDRSMVIALNMYDELLNAGATLDYETLGNMIGVPIVPTISRTGEGINQLFDRIIEVYEGRDKTVRHVHVNLGSDIESGVRMIKDQLKSDTSVDLHFSPRYLAIKMLERDKEVENLLSDSPNYNNLVELRDREVKRIERLCDEDITSAIANEKYGFIAGALAETMSDSEKDTTQSTRIIDALVTSKLFGFPIFMLIMFFIFWTTFQVGSYPMEWIDSGVKLLDKWVGAIMDDGPLKSLISDGLLGGVGGVIVFLPNIMILYFFISFMEDSGYMARAAFIMDKMMHKIGLHGKSFIPLIMGFGCNVPALLASRAIESKSSRIITILINPFMSCSARLPIYLLLAGAFFPSCAPLVLFGLYILGILVAVVTAKLLRRFYFKVDETPFVMELPPYRVPTLKTSIRHMWDKGAQYLRKMGGVILFASIIVWALNYFPHHDEVATSSAIATAAQSSEINPETDSFLEMMGKAVNPIMEPLGFHWRATVAIVAGIPAKEIVVSTLGVVDGTSEFTMASALSFMVFVLLYCPCLASVTAIVKETGNWRYGAFSVFYNTLVAWLAAFIVFLVASLF